MPGRIARGARAARRPALRALALGAALAGVIAAPVAPPGGDTSQAVARERVIRIAPDLRVFPRLHYGYSPRTVVDVYSPGNARRARALPGVLVVHGGGWRAGDKRRMAWTSRRLADAGFVAFNVNYTHARLGRPGFPRQLTELRTAVAWIRRHAHRLGVDPTRIGAIGSSAGGHLVGLLATDAHGPLTAGARVAAVVTWSAPFDLTRVEHGGLVSAVRTFVGCVLCPQVSMAASPPTHVTGDDPPMLIVNSEHELVPLAHAELMAARLASAGIPHTLRVLPGSGHGRDYAWAVLGPSIGFLYRTLR